MKIVPLFVALHVILPCVFAADPIPVVQLGKATPLKFAEGEMVLEAEENGWRVQAPSFWKCGWQVKQPSLPAMEAGGDKRFLVIAEGASANEQLVMKLRLVSRDWARADIYEISLAGLNAGDFAEYAASTAYGQPAEQEGGGLAPGEDIGALQFLFAGKGKEPIQLTLKEIGLR